MSADRHPARGRDGKSRVRQIDLDSYNSPSLLDTTHTLIPRQLPLETIEEIITEAWKATADASERLDLHSTLKAAHPTLGAVIDRVATRFIILASLRPTEPSDGVLYIDILRNLQRVHHAADVEPASEEHVRKAAERFRWSHVRLDVETMRYHDCNQLLKSQKTLLQPVYNVITSVTIGSVRSGERVGIPTETVLRFLGRLPCLTRLHLDFDEDQYRYEPRTIYLDQKGGPIVFSAVTYLRTRTCPGCGLSSSTYAGARDQMHASECFKNAFGRTFPNLRELQLDAPLFLKYLDAPRTLESVTISAPPTMKLFCSIQAYNVATGLRRWLEWREGESVSKGRRMPLKKVVVRTGKDEPIGWQQAREACERFGVEIVREVYFY